MPPPLAYNPLELRSIHLLRNLLRETSYLPDANARTYFHRYILGRFRKYQPRRNAVPSAASKAVKRRPDAVIVERTRDQQRKAQKALNYLRRANIGEQTALWKVMLFTYGRMGPRRYVLLEELLRPDNPGEEEGIPPLQEKYHSDKRWLQFFKAPSQKEKKLLAEGQQSIEISDRFSRLRNILNSQVAEGISLGSVIKQPRLITPINNVWERPMPVKRARNDVRRWYAFTMARVLPPLPTDEWDTLNSLATGETKWTDHVPRRSRKDTVPLSDEEKSASIIHTGLWLAKPSLADRPRGKLRPHDLTPQTMRRLYARLLSYCPKLEWNEKYNKWSANWGNRKGLNPRTYNQPVDSTLFSGVDAKGRRLTRAPSKSTKPASSAEVDSELHPS